jgi:tRNA U34 5-methylaminomethyl-2-thiouridine-forming methyltransferase MnmC
MSNTTIVTTEDGSSTLFNCQNGEHYHSIHGAIQESAHVFINAGLRYISSAGQLRILEIGFGTGLNCLLSLAETTGMHKDTAYYALEPFPVDELLPGELNYCQFEGLKNFERAFKNMHSIEDGILRLGPFFELTRLRTKLEETILHPSYFNLVYFDAFSAEAQPELWQPEIFGKIRASMATGGVLVTYAAKGSVRRALQTNGFVTERLPGPPGKREMLRATAI